MEQISATLRALRQQRQLTLQDVETRSNMFADQKDGDESFRISASWLNRLESQPHKLTLSKLIVLAHIYGVSPEYLLRIGCKVESQPGLSKLVSNAITAVRPKERTAIGQEGLLRTNVPGIEAPEDSLLILVPDSVSAPRYRHGLIGNRDQTLYPMIPPGSIVQIDTENRAIVGRKNWKHEFQRPIYFLRSPDSYVCGWCELDKTSDWLTLIPHPLAPTSSRRWKYPLDITNVGRVVSVAIGLAI